MRSLKLKLQQSQAHYFTEVETGMTREQHETGQFIQLKTNQEHIFNDILAFLAANLKGQFAIGSLVLAIGFVM